MKNFSIDKNNASSTNEKNPYDFQGVQVRFYIL